ncbi:MAG: polymer-forming cytoskeletal protein [Syntrophomonadaceae bacterium]|jgi:uncharacterized protein YjeT (DUF2065 family)/cytoskeletal protein CcmA (bactofilin family)|nr:polymer-forming cytoskeletal protein [Syntrophomonadaceae bacterium]
MLAKTRAGYFVAAVLFFAFLLSPAALAVQKQSGDSVYIPPGQIEGPLFVSGNSIVVDADVEGDVFAAGQNININGKVNGDIMAAGQSVRIAAAVDGDVRVAGNDISIQSSISRNLSIAGNTIRLEQTASIGKDVLLFGTNVDILGTVNRQVLGAAQNFRLAGSIGSDLRLWEVNSLNLGPAAAIGGDLIYKSPQQAQIASGARVGGETRWEQGAADPIKPQQQVSWPSLLMWFAAGVVLWGLGYLLFPSLWQGLASALEEAPGASIGWGILLLVATPFIFVILLITVIGIPVALILLLAYILLLYLSKIILGDILGRYLLRSFKWEGRFSMWIGFMMGFALVILLSKIPIVGILITLAAAIIALGCTALSIFDSRRRSRPDPAQ